MTQAPIHPTPSTQRHPRRGLLAIYLELAKAPLTAMVLATTATGFLLVNTQPIAWTTLLWTLLATALAGAGANGLNQCLEAPFDAQMVRTAARPVAALRITKPHAYIWSILMAFSGVALLALKVNVLTASLCAATVLLYVLVYTPLKQRDPICTLVGALVGAAPPVMGWTAATNTISGPAWLLGAILFTWQIPHSLALAWLYRQDYARGGYHILSWNDPSGRKTFHIIVIYTLCLIAASISLYLSHRTGPMYALGAIVLGTGLLKLALRLQRTGQDIDARRLFMATVIYLPLLLGIMLIDRR